MGDAALFGAYWRNLVEMGEQDGMESVDVMVSVLECEELQKLVCHLVNAKVWGYQI